MPKWIQEVLDSGRRISTENEKSRALNYLESLRQKGEDVKADQIYKKLFPHPERFQDTKLLEDDMAKAKILDLNEALRKAKRAEIGEVRGNRRKVAEGKWETVTGGKQTSGEKPTAKEMTAQEHQKEMNRHFDEAMKYSDMLQKLEDRVEQHRKINRRFKVPEKAQRLMDEVKNKVKFHKKQYEQHKSQGKQNWKKGTPKEEQSQKYQTQRAKDSNVKKSTAELNNLLKGRALPEGTIRQHGTGTYQKKNGKWVSVPTPRNTKNDANYKRRVDNYWIKDKINKLLLDRQAEFTERAYILIRSGLLENSDEVKQIKSEINEKYIKQMTKLVEDQRSTPRIKESMARRFLIQDNPLKMENAVKINKSLKELDDLLKSVVSLDHQGTALETGHFAEELEDGPKKWMNYFYNMMNGFEYGEAPRELTLDSGYVMTLAKVDDGQYSGYVKKLDADTDLSDYSNDGSVNRVDKMTIPEIVQFCLAKEYISPQEVINDNGEEPELVEAEPVELPEPQLDVPVAQPPKHYLVEKLVDLLDKLLD